MRLTTSQTMTRPSYPQLFMFRGTSLLLVTPRRLCDTQSRMSPQSECGRDHLTLNLVGTGVDRGCDGIT